MVIPMFILVLGLVRYFQRRKQQRQERVS